MFTLDSINALGALYNLDCVRCYSLKKELPGDVYTAAHFLMMIIDKAELSQDVITKIVPEMLLNQLEYLSNK